MVIGRRDFLVLAGAAATFSRAAHAQLGRLPRVALAGAGLTVADMTTAGDPSWAAFIQELARQGFVEGATVTFERRIAGAAAAADAARAIVSSAPDVIFWGGAATAAVPALQLTKT